MMSKDQFEDLSKYLRSIDEKLEILIALQKRALPKAEVGKEENKVLQFCDKKHPISDIAKETGKTENNVKVILSRLKDKGLIRSLEIKGAIVYEKI